MKLTRFRFLFVLNSIRFSSSAGDFENYLECWLRTYGNPSAKYVCQLHDTLYGGQRSQPPQPSEFHGILHAATLNADPEKMAGRTSLHLRAPSSQQGGHRHQSSLGSHPQAPAAISAAPRNSAQQQMYAPQPVQAPIMPQHQPVQAPEDTTTEWHFIDVASGQHGPVMASELKAAWLAGQVDSSCIAWNPDLPDWSPIAAMPQLIDYLNN